MPTIAKFIDRLRNDGREDSRGEFTLDPDKAREKMQQFQLADPKMYVLLLVQAAIVKGAGGIFFEIDTDDMIMRFDGEPFTLTDFRGIFTSFFTRSESRATQARRKLAFGINAAMALNPRWALVESGDGRSGAWLRMVPGKPEEVGSADKPMSGTRIHVKDRLRPGLILDFIDYMSDQIHEVELLKQRCGYAPIPIVVNGNDISVRNDVCREVIALQKPTADEPIRGWLGFKHGGGAFGIRLIKNGVWLDTIQPEPQVMDLIGIIEADQVKMDMSQNAVIRNDNLEQVMAAVVRLRERALAGVCNSYSQLGPDTPADIMTWYGKLLMQALGNFGFAAWFKNYKKDSFVAAVANVKLWRQATGNCDKVDLEQMNRQVKRYGKLFVSMLSAEGCEYRKGLLVVKVGLPESEDYQCLQQLFPHAFKDVTRSIQRILDQETKRKAWLAGVAAPKLQPMLVSAAVPIDDPEIKGEVGLSRAAGVKTSSISVVVSGHPLCIIDDVCILPGLMAIVAADFKPRKSYDMVVKDALWARAILEIVMRLDELVRRLLVDSTSDVADPDAGMRKFFKAYLHARTNAGFPVDLLHEYGFSKGSAMRYVKDCLPDDRYQPLRLGVGRLQGPINTGTAEKPHPLLRAPLFLCLAGRYLSLADIAAEIDAVGSVRVVADTFSIQYYDKENVLRLEQQDRQIISAIFGSDSIIDAGLTIQR